MKTQYVVNGTMVRPLESLASNFASSRYYNGKEIIDRLENIETAQEWVNTMSQELGTWPPFQIHEEDLLVLQRLREHIISLYFARVDENEDAVKNTLSALTSTVDTQVRHISVIQMVNSLNATQPTSSFSQLVALISVSAALTVTGETGSRLRKCHAPHCVLFYTQNHPKQRWCSNTCGNRSRVNRHYYQSQQ